jgi:cytochrome c553
MLSFMRVAGPRGERRLISPREKTHEKSAWVVCCPGRCAGCTSRGYRSGKELAATVCAVCHGATGVSVSDAIPNLAAQRPAYIEAQLKAFKDGRRKHSGATSNIMNVIQLSAQDIANVAAYFASQPGAAMGTKSRPE